MLLLAILMGYATVRILWLLKHKTVEVVANRAYAVALREQAVNERAKDQAFEAFRSQLQVKKRRRIEDLDALSFETEEAA